MCNFWSGIVTRSGKVIWYDSIWSHEKQIEMAGLKDDKLVNRDFVRVEISTEKNIYKGKPKMSEFKFRVDEEGTLPHWFDRNRAAKACWNEFKKAYKTDKLFNRDDIRKFIKSLKKIKWLKPDGKPRKEWKVFYGRTWAAARDAAGAAAGAAARNATRDTAWVAAWNAAGAAAGAAARTAAWNAVMDAARAATRDAALTAKQMVISDLKYENKKKHEAHAKKRMEVWKKGYALYCDVNGELYVYAKKSGK